MIFGMLDRVLAPGGSNEVLTQKLHDLGKLRDERTTVALIGEFAALDSKSSSLLQHVSIMIAALSVSYSVNPPAPVKAILLANIFFYLVAILFILRVIITVDFSSSPDAELRLVRELKAREKYYTVAHSIASILTAFLVVSAIAVAVYYR
jgi:hypothetical protein